MKIAIINYKSGNIRSVENAFTNVAKKISSQNKVIVSALPERILESDKVVLPGVGSFLHCKKNLLKIKGMLEAIREIVKKKPFLGICVGMQLMAEKGFENGNHDGLGLISGVVKKLNIEKKKLQIPHMGWNEIKKQTAHPLLKNISNGQHFYFVHSYHMLCSNKKNILATTDYGQEIVAAIAKDNIAGVQFHPEKSQDSGQVFIEEFLKWNP